MALRGLHASDLARKAGLSEATLCAALQGRRVSVRTLTKIAVALSRVPAVAVAEALLETA
jgi:predicted transcriptional regulator